MATTQIPQEPPGIAGLTTTRTLVSTGGGDRTVLTAWAALDFADSIGAVGSTPLILNSTKLTSLSWTQSAAGVHSFSYTGVTTQARTIRDVPQIQWDPATLFGADWYAPGRTIQVAIKMSSVSVTGTSETGLIAGLVSGTSGSGGLAALEGNVPGFSYYQIAAGEARFYPYNVFTTGESFGDLGYFDTDYDGSVIVLESVMRQTPAADQTPFLSVRGYDDTYGYVFENGFERSNTFDPNTALFILGRLADDTGGSTDARSGIETIMVRLIEAPTSPF